MNDAVTWPALLLLGGLHGLNPAMGWLFAVALGLQQRAPKAVWRALLPIALGHALSILLVLLLVGLAGLVLDGQVLRWVGAGAILAFGAYKLLRPDAHPRWVGMKVGFRDLTLWSFLMSTAHGAGLMLLPLVLPPSGHADALHHAAHSGHLMPSTAPVWAGLGAVAVHTLGMFTVMASVALLVYHYVGLTILRQAWVNLDRVWAAALLAAGTATLLWR
ncbi:hypothetical protein K7W42_05095 [Deinococcus sp. HMF7604]|uniref:hypothetical protein n=1 Tax=Deinococcus betulae TaxID=2873312 RepID=UPI001CCFEE10|nr:hypothetical protein [Deinococcus betulae]MBZ9750236.1 hypothetical protein [Deinococcus betulae]